MDYKVLFFKRYLRKAMNKNIGRFSLLLSVSVPSVQDMTKHESCKSLSTYSKATWHSQARNGRSYSGLLQFEVANIQKKVTGWDTKQNPLPQPHTIKHVL